MNQQNQKLYVGNLNYDANEEQVKELFGTYGEVQDVKIVMDRFTGRSRGFAFVRLDTADSAGKAKEGLNGQPFMGKTLVIDWARTEQKEGGGFRSQNSGERRERSEFKPRREWGGGGGGGGFDRAERGERRGGYGNDRYDRSDRGYHGR